VSTKIYTGFQIATASLTEVLEIINRFRPRIEQEALQLMQQFMETAAPGDFVQGLRVWHHVRQMTVRQGLRCPAVDTEFYVVLFPQGDRFLGVAYTEQSTWFESWIAQPKVSEFGYWNNTDDLPEGVSAETFTSRAKDWDQVVGRDPPAMRGFRIDISDPHGPSVRRLPKPGVDPPADNSPDGEHSVSVPTP
jgi:hypothetical protein